MKAIVSFLLATGLACAASPAWSVDSAREDQSQPPASESLEAGRRAVGAKDFASAVGPLTKASEETPNDADVHNLLGYSYRKLGRFDKALEHYRLALNINPNHRGAHEYIGELYLELGQLANAEKQLQALSKACPWFGQCEEYEELKEAIAKYKANRRTS